ncbi:MAG: 30S ribosome-binding factor RbfA [Lachnospiraceae bacterium]|nr:30S ribosome-binding factor RbfA [Lachnospiraceae bacterium]
MRKHSVKNTRVNGEVQKVLAEIIRGEIKDPRISPWTSVVAVEVAPDLKTCKAWISVLGDSEAAAATLQGLKSAEGFIRRQLARTLNLRNTPVITFVLDQSIEYGVNMSHKIAEVMAKDSAAADEPDEDFETDEDFDDEDFDDEDFDGEDFDDDEE